MRLYARPSKARTFPADPTLFESLAFVENDALCTRTLEAHMFPTLLLADEPTPISLLNCLFTMAARNAFSDDDDMIIKQI